MNTCAHMSIRSIVCMNTVASTCEHLKLFDSPHQALVLPTSCVSVSLNKGAQNKAEEYLCVKIHFSFNVCGCFTFMYVCTWHVCLLSTQVRRRCQIPWDWAVVSLYVGAGSEIWVLWMSSHPLTPEHLSSPEESAQPIFSELDTSVEQNKVPSCFTPSTAS